MKYHYLMHKDDKVAKLELDMNSGNVIDYDVVSRELMPVYVDSANAMKEWWRMRSVPSSREKLVSALMRKGISSVLILMIRNFALSLSDCYWIVPEDYSIKWNDINFFKNSFRKFSISTILSLQNVSKGVDEKLDLTPYFTLNGRTPKYWEIQSGKRILFKQAKDNMSRHQCLNEFFGTVFHESLGMYDCVKQSLHYDDNGLITKVASPCFCDEDREYIPMISLLSETQVYNYRDNDLCQKLLDSLENIGLDRDKSRDFILYCHLTDFIISNEDRHLYNYGIIRDSNTLKPIDFAPVFDNGNSMLYRGAEDFYSPFFRTLKTKSSGLYSNDGEILKACRDFYGKIDLLLLPAPQQVYEIYKNNLYKHTTQNAEFIAKAYDYKIKVLDMVRNGAAVYDIAIGKIQVPEWNL